MQNKIETIETLAQRAHDLTRVARDSCGYNEYFAQETVLTQALDIQEKILEKLFELV